jgi:Uma2 family endonuclease
MERTGATDPDLFQLATRQRPLTVEEYHRMGDAGILGEDDPVELLDGHLIAMSPIGPSHLHCVNRLNKLFARRLYAGDDPSPWISMQNPIRLSDTSEPEPDLVLLRPDAPQDRTPIPADVLLVVEVADSSVDYDRSIKAPRYAAAGVPVFWLVDLGGEFVDVSDTPDADTYAHRHRYHRGDTIPLPEGVDGDPIPVDDVMGEADDG